MPHEPQAPAPVLSYQAPRTGKTMTVAWCADLTEAEQVCDELRRAGVPAALVNQHTAALGPYAGGSRIEIQVMADDRRLAAEVLARLTWLHELEPESEPRDGSADFTTDGNGNRSPLAVAAAYGTVQEMLDAAAALAAVKLRTFLPDLVPHRDADTDAPPPVFKVRVRAEELGRAKAVLDELGAEGDESDLRCPKCASWRVHRHAPGLLAWLKSWLGAKDDRGGGERFACIRCHYQWENPRAFEVVAPGMGPAADDAPTPPPATGR